MAKTTFHCECLFGHLRSYKYDTTVDCYFPPYVFPQQHRLYNENQLSQSLFYTQNGFFNCGSFYCSAYLKDSYGQTKPSTIVVLDCWMHSGLLCVLLQTCHHYPNLHCDHIILLHSLQLFSSHMISNDITMTVQQVFEPLTCYGPFTTVC